MHPPQVRGRPLVARRVGCGAKPCRELRRSTHSEQSGVLSWRMTHAWGAWLPGRRQGDRYTLGKRVHPLPVFRLVEDMLTPCEGWEGYRRGLTLADGGVLGYRKKRKEERKPEKARK